MRNTSSIEHLKILLDAPTTKVWFHFRNETIGNFHWKVFVAHWEKGDW